MHETLKELAAELAVIHESLERAEVIERQLPTYLREIEADLEAVTAERDQLRADVARWRETAENYATHCGRACEQLEAAERERYEALAKYEQLTQLCKATEERERCFMAHAAYLRGALEDQPCRCVFGTPDPSKIPAWNRISECSRCAAIARTPAHSLNRIKAGVLREAVEEVRNDEAAQESAATTRGAILCVADRLDAHNAPPKP